MNRSMKELVSDNMKLKLSAEENKRDLDGLTNQMARLINQFDVLKSVNIELAVDNTRFAKAAKLARSAKRKATRKLRDIRKIALSIINEA